VFLGPIAEEHVDLIEEQGATLLTANQTEERRRCEV